jgi:DNA-binding NarL/FixJ family response regulator
MGWQLVTCRLLVLPGHRVESQCVVAVLEAAGLPATTDPDARDVEAVVAVVPHDASIAATLDATSAERRQLPVLLLASQVIDDAAVMSAMSERCGVAAVASLDGGTDAFVATARRLLDGRRPLPHSSPASEAATLTAREHQVLALLAAGQRNQEIADELGISSHTVRTHVQHLLTKLDVHHRQAAALARPGLLTENGKRAASSRQGMFR